MLARIFKAIIRRVHPGRLCGRIRLPYVVNLIFLLMFPIPAGQPSNMPAVPCRNPLIPHIPFPRKLPVPVLDQVMPIAPSRRGDPSTPPGAPGTFARAAGPRASGGRVRTTGGRAADRRRIPGNAPPAPATALVRYRFVIGCFRTLRFDPSGRGGSCRLPRRRPTGCRDAWPLAGNKQQAGRTATKRPAFPALLPRGRDPGNEASPVPHTEKSNSRLSTEARHQRPSVGIPDTRYAAARIPDSRPPRGSPTAYNIWPAIRISLIPAGACVGPRGG